ncbi:hypothetical protein JCM3765_002509 [Sporobolomyces pararoseus]
MGSSSPSTTGAAKTANTLKPISLDRPCTIHRSAHLWIAFEKLEMAQSEIGTRNSAAHKEQCLQDRLLAYALLREIYLLYVDDLRRVRDARRVMDTEEESKLAARKILDTLGREYLDHERNRESLRADHTSCVLLVAGNCFRQLGYVELNIRRAIDGVIYTECHSGVWLGVDRLGRLTRSSENFNLGNRSSAIYGHSAGGHRSGDSVNCGDGGVVLPSINRNFEYTF